MNHERGLRACVRDYLQRDKSAPLVIYVNTTDAVMPQRADLRSEPHVLALISMRQPQAVQQIVEIKSRFPTSRVIVFTDGESRSDPELVGLCASGTLAPDAVYEPPDNCEQTEQIIREIEHLNV